MNTSERLEYPFARDTKPGVSPPRPSATIYPTMEEHKGERSERICANEVCGCTLADTSDAEYCSEYCAGEGPGRGEGTCQCGHVGCW